MPALKQTVGFELSVSGRDDGTLEAAYFRVKKGKVARTEEVVPDTVMADYDSSGELLGIEVLAPVRLSVLANQVERARRSSFRKFVRQSAPHELVRD
jgi:uncharacterized protein YuzE